MSLVLPVRRVLDDSGIGESGSLKVLVVRRRLLTTASASHNRVGNDSSFKLWPCCFTSAAIMFRTDRICRSQTKLLAVTGFLIQSMLSLSNYALILSSSISWSAAINLISAPTKLVPWSLRSSFIGPLRQVKRRNVCKNKSVSMGWATLICITRLTKQINRARYLLTSFLLF